MVIGADDTEIWEIRLTPADSWWMEAAEALAEANRIERMAALRASLEDNGVAVEQEVVADAAHDGRLMLPCVERWFAKVLEQARAKGKERP
jgi:hypothetical protein